MRKAIFLAFVVVAVCGCSDKTDPNEKNFRSAVDAYLSKKGSLCLNDQAWPVELNELDKKIGSSLGGAGPASRMEALTSQGLAAASEIDKPILSYGGKSTGRTQPVTRYELTEKGKQYFHESTGSYGKPKEGEVRGELCYGKKAVDKVVKWEGPMKLGEYQAATVKYLYKVDNIADWAKSSEIQSAFPSVKDWVDGAGNKQQSHVVRLTSIGWEANGIDLE